MNLSRIAKRVLIATAMAMMLVFFLCAPALAQCAMCRASVNNSNYAALTKNLNLGVLVLLIPPVTIFCSIFIVAFKHYRGQQETRAGDTDVDQPPQ